MKVILCEDVPKIGVAGEVKTVSDGYARNFLMPRKLALIATAGNIRKWESEKKVREIRLSQDLEAAKKSVAQLEQISLDITAKAGREGHLFGSITNAMIADALLAKGFPVDKKNIVLDMHIKTLGEHKINIRLHAQLSAVLKINVSPSADSVMNAAAVQGADIPETSPVTK